MTTAPLLAALVLLLPAVPTYGQETPGDRRPYEGSAEVVAVDAVVDLGPGPAAWLPGGRSVRAPDSLEATIDGAPAPVVAVQGPAGRRRPLGRVVLYFDLSLSDDHQLTWAAERLGDRARELVALGPVEVVVASPVPITRLEPTRDRAALEEALGQIGYLSEPSDDLVELRLETGTRGDGDPAPRERSLVRDRLDALLLALVDRSAAAVRRNGEDEPDADPRRVVLLASGGFDLPGFEAGVEATGCALAAYGWRIVPVLAPERRALRPGKRIGKWRIFGAGATYEEDRDPERAGAFLELAKALREQGELAKAADAAEDAAYHFYGDPRTADREAEALLLAAALHGELGDTQRARRMLRKAARVDPEALDGHPVLAAVPRAPDIALSALAAPGGGVTVRDEEGLRRALAGSAKRAVVTVQAPVTREPSETSGDGIGRLVLRPAGGGEESASGWVRMGTPIAVTEARARSL